MANITMAADSTSLILNGFPIVDFAEGDIIELNPANELTSRVNSAEGGVTVQKRVDAGVTDLIVRVQKMSNSDVFLNSLRNQEVPELIQGSAKEDYNRDGTEGVESFILENGSITTQPGNTKNNQDGNAMMEYTIQFRNAVRNL